MPDPGPGGSGGGYVASLETAFAAAQDAFDLVDTGDITIPEWPTPIEPVTTECQIILLIRKTACLVGWIACFESYPLPRTPQDEAYLQDCVDGHYENLLNYASDCIVAED